MYTYIYIYIYIPRLSHVYLYVIRTCERIDISNVNACSVLSVSASLLCCSICISVCQISIAEDERSSDRQPPLGDRRPQNQSLSHEPTRTILPPATSLPTALIHHQGSLSLSGFLRLVSFSADRSFIFALACSSSATYSSLAANKLSMRSNPNLFKSTGFRFSVRN